MDQGRQLTYADWHSAGGPSTHMEARDVPNNKMPFKHTRSQHDPMHCFAMFLISPLVSTNWLPVSCTNNHADSTVVCEKRVYADPPVDRPTEPEMTVYQPLSNNRCPSKFTYFKGICITLLTTANTNNEHDTLCKSWGGTGVLHLNDIPISKIVGLLKIWRFSPSYGSVRLNDKFGECNELIVVDKGKWLDYEFNISQCQGDLHHVLCEGQPFTVSSCQTSHYQCKSGECIIDSRVGSERLSNYQTRQLSHVQFLILFKNVRF